MINIEDLKVGDVLIGRATGIEYTIVYISKNNNIFSEYSSPSSGNVISALIQDPNAYSMKPKQTKVYVVIWRYDNKINIVKIYNESYLSDVKNNLDVLDILEYYEDI